MQRVRDRAVILVVEDDAEALRSVTEILEERWDVVGARSAEHAVSQWERERPDAMVLDLRLGGGRDGLDAYQEIRRRIGRKPRTLVVSGAVEAPRAARALELRWLEKPFNADDLIAAVERLLS